jgi:hypothetical protein
MADVNKTIEISYTANIGALERALKKIPGITEEQMKKAINEVEKELKQAERAADKTSKSFKEKFSNMSKSASMAGVAIAGAGYAMLEFGQRIADATNDLVDTSTKTGIAAETLQGLKIAAEGSGLAFEQFIGPLQRLQFLMVEANNKNKTATKLFRDMGVEVNETSGELRSADDVFRDMMKSLGEMDSDLERNAFLMKTFGKQGAMFAQSGVVGALDEFVSLGREFGLDVGPEAVRQAANFQRAMADMSAVGTGAMQDILLTITGTNGLTSAIDYLTEGIIYFEATFKTVFAAISIPVTILQGEIYTLLTMMTDGVQAGKAAWAATADLFKEDVNTLKNSFSEAEEKITALRVARVKIREQQDDNATNESKNNQTSRKELNIKIEQLEKIIELQKDDLDVLGNIFEAQGKLLDISVELYKGELSDEDKLRKAHEDRLEKIKEIQYAQQQAYQQRTTDLEKALNEGQISEEDYMARRIEMRDEILEMYEQGNQARYFSEQKLQQDLVDLEKAAIDEIIEERKAMNQQLIDESMNLVNGISSAFLQIQDNATQQYIRNRDEAIENIEKMEKSGVISAEESARQRTDIENAYQQTIEKQMMKSFRMKQSAAVAGILIDMAQATARAMADYPFPASVGIAALAAGKAGLELAAVQSQPPPKFDVGGMVGQSDPLAPDQTQAQLLTGEAVLDRATVQRLGGEQGLRDLQNMPQQKVVVIQPFKHFDRFLSAGEKRGRFGTARASGRY